MEQVDIVARLRELSNDWVACGPHTEVEKEAADLIERLLAERDETCAELEKMGQAANEAEEQCDRMRAALEEIAQCAGNGRPRRVARMALRGADSADEGRK